MIREEESAVFLLPLYFKLFEAISQVRYDIATTILSFVQDVYNA
ncbi:hypothetical protein M104_4702 [Bacteroides fragilis str. 1007-1-F |uniref:Uncharacterized protein n=1 Tax=Bacteroides fragilis str. 1007-1-F \|nr:hypothetical protein M067_4518 [Bacteroides fragilis str. J-143-4]EXZ50928.1 hypothetical protein M109_0343 [Bacteroides fragilis str. 3397 N2]EXZ55647.1 hypothetical protein M108_0340 [Bacteroides fragilis str. 3397 T14]EYA12229.1 hypothetical protein M104_4702 [Bacteroides fragilis str. 1007-1-F \